MEEDKEGEREQREKSRARRRSGEQAQEVASVPAIGSEARRSEWLSRPPGEPLYQGQRPQPGA